MALLSVDDALALVLKGLAPLEAEDVFLDEALGRILACDVAATLTQPPFDASAMDGYAVRATDVSSLPTNLAVVGESAAGARFSGYLEPGQAVRIFTGAPVPDGADVVVIQEDTESDAGRVVVKAVSQGGYIRPRGQDFHKGDVLLKRGTRLGARTLMLAAATNCQTLSVCRKPRVAILATGDEVMPPGADLGPDQIVCSASYGIAGIVAAHGAEALNLGIAADDPESIGTLARAGAGADILVTIGGASVGERDLVLGTLADDGFTLDFAKVAMRPGKPVFYGRLGSQRVLGVPGNPVSAFVCTIVFLVPMLRAMFGVAQSDEPAPEALLGAGLPANGPRQHYLRAVSTWRADGERLVHPLPSQDSSLVGALARADCLVVLPPRTEALPEGTRVPIIPLADWS